MKGIRGQLRNRAQWVQLTQRVQRVVQWLHPPHQDHQDQKDLNLSPKKEVTK